MKRYALYAEMLALAMVCTAGLAEAQSAPAPAADRGYVEVTTGPTFGHKTGASIGVEGAWYLKPMLGIFAEGGHLTNVTTTNVQNDAQLIASFIGGSASPKTTASYFDVGVTYRFPRTGRLPMTARRFYPYALLGFGAGHASNKTTFSVGGASANPSDYGVQLGTDLSGSYTKLFVTAGLGIHIPVGPRWIGDVSYRYGRIGRDTSNGGDIAAISTNRLQFGFGRRF